MSGQTTKSFEISKQLVWEAYTRVAANTGAAGVDGGSVEAFEKDLKNNLYKIWNRMSSASYFPPPVKSVDIPKPGWGTRTLGVPTVADRIAQTVVAMTLEARTEAIFHEDSYGYRPRRSALRFTVKGNQPPLRRALARLPWAQMPGLREREVGHGRTESRSIKVIDLDGAPEAGLFPHGARASKVVRRRGCAGQKKPSVERVYAITSLDHRDADARLSADWIRSNWTIE